MELTFVAIKDSVFISIISVSPPHRLDYKMLPHRGPGNEMQFHLLFYLENDSPAQSYVIKIWSIVSEAFVHWSNVANVFH